jgi:hypothetical protein
MINLRTIIGPFEQKIALREDLPVKEAFNLAYQYMFSQTALPFAVGPEFGWEAITPEGVKLDVSKSMQAQGLKDHSIIFFRLLTPWDVPFEVLKGDLGSPLPEQPEPTEKPKNVSVKLLHKEPLLHP